MAGEGRPGLPPFQQEVARMFFALPASGSTERIHDSDTFCRMVIRSADRAQAGTARSRAGRPVLLSCPGPSRGGTGGIAAVAARSRPAWGRDSANCLGYQTVRREKV
jgi:hypothetical protein